jgi:hypothetical protein
MRTIEHTGTLETEIVDDGSEGGVAYRSDNPVITYTVEVEYNVSDDRSGDWTTPSGEPSVDVHKCRMVKILIERADGSESESDYREVTPALRAEADDLAETAVYADLNKIEERICRHVFGD